MPRSFVLWLPPESHPDQLQEAELQFAAGRELELKPAEIAAARITRYSFDARKRHMMWRVAVDAWLVGEEPPAPVATTPRPIAPPPQGARRVVVIGAGPAGMFCALELLRGGCAVTLLERGKQVQERRRDIAALNHGEPADPDSNYCFGEGGAGTYSDGKLYARSGRPEEVRAVLKELVAHGAPESILTSWRPHIGSNRLPKVVEALRESLIAGGAELRFGARVEEILTQGAPARVRGVRLAGGEEIAADAVVLAAGHSALDSVRMAEAAGATLEAKGFALGVRVEHPQAWLDRQQYHGVQAHSSLPAAFYELTAQVHERGVYSFCMCPGGWIVPSQTDPATLVVNGMSLAKRDSPFANSGLVVGVEPKDWCGKRGWRWGWPELLKKAAALSGHPMLHQVVVDPRGGAPIEVAEGRLPVHPAIDPCFGVRLQLALETLAAAAGGGGNRAPAQRCSDYVGDLGAASPPLESSYLPGLEAADFRQILPKGLAIRLREALVEFDTHLPGFAGEQGQLIGVETRTSSPVRVVRDESTLQSPTLPGLYPCGEGAGYAGGIVSAALDGVRLGRIVSGAVPELHG
ncbi:MAG: FAD-dependent oxidoreductase [Planctomycetes bacterium]|nr:FAD-dependent oxidoreductase [Planctomycetota bacterium]